MIASITAMTKHVYFTAGIREAMVFIGLFIEKNKNKQIHNT